MTPEQVKRVQDSFAKVAPMGDTVADLFYERLFRIAPDIRALFPADLSRQKKKLTQMLVMAVTNLHEVEKVIPALQALGRRHIGYGVTREQYEPVGAALLWTLEQHLGSAFTPQVRDAWTAAYSIIAEVMKAGGADISRQPERKRGPLAQMFR